MLSDNEIEEIFKIDPPREALAYDDIQRLALKEFFGAGADEGLIKHFGSGLVTPGHRKEFEKVLEKHLMRYHILPPRTADFPLESYKMYFINEDGKQEQLPGSISVKQVMTPEEVADLLQIPVQEVLQSVQQERGLSQLKTASDHL